MGIRELRTKRRAQVCAVAVLLLSAACTGDDPGGDSPGLDPAIRMTAVTLAVVGDVPRLEWDSVNGVDRYRVGAGQLAIDVPATVCHDRCRLTVNRELVGTAKRLEVSAVKADGAYSEPAVVTVGLPQAQRENTPRRKALEVLLIHAPTDPDDPPRVKTVVVGSEQEADAVIEKSWTDPTVLSASINTPVNQTAAAPDDTVPTEGTWQTEAMDFESLPGKPRGEGIVIATLEPDGVDASHPSLRGAAMGGTHILDPNADGTTDPDVHATGVASLMVGQPAGAVPGIAPGATVLPVNVGSEAMESDVIKGMIWAVDHCADIINISLADSCDSFGPLTSCPDSMRAGTDYAEKNGVVVVAGAGNNGSGGDCDPETNAKVWPAVLDTVISVGAYEQGGKRWACTPDRPDVDLLAPGRNLLFADVGTSYAIGTGTSFAAPLVAGLIATILAEKPELTPAEIRAMLPQWVRADGRLDVFASLVSAGIIEHDEFDPPSRGRHRCLPLPGRASVRAGASHRVRTPWCDSARRPTSQRGLGAADDQPGVDGAPCSPGRRQAEVRSDLRSHHPA